MYLLPGRNFTFRDLAVFWFDQQFSFVISFRVIRIFLLYVSSFGLVIELYPECFPLKWCNFYWKLFSSYGGHSHCTYSFDQFTAVLFAANFFYAKFFVLIWFFFSFQLYQSNLWWNMNLIYDKSATSGNFKLILLIHWFFVVD